MKATNVLGGVIAVGAVVAAFVASRSLGSAMHEPAPDAGTSALWSDYITPASDNYALLASDKPGDLYLMANGTTVHVWKGGATNPCLMGCAAFAGPLASQEQPGAKDHPYVAAMLGCAARCSDAGSP